MSGYKGQGDNKNRTPVDGAEIFTEAHRRAAHRVLSTGKPDTELTYELRRLATQRPFPSHQASFLLDRLIEQGLALIPGYDEMISEAWRADAADYPHLSQLALAGVGVHYEFEGDGR